jgi:hypothetical protein
MWKHLLEGLAGPDTSQLIGLRRLAWDWRRLLAEAGLLLGLLAASSWLVRP